MSHPKNRNWLNSIIQSSKCSVEQSLFLSDFVLFHKLPTLALITKGQYLTIGSPYATAPNLNPYVLVYSKQNVRKLVGKLVKWKDNKSYGLTDQKVSLSTAFHGYFEILSEDGRPTKCLESVKELVDVFPDVCIVRQPCKVYLPDAEGELTSLYRTRNLREGEMLTLVGRFHYKHNSFLRCFDESGKSIFMKITGNAGATSNATSKYKFSPVARDEEAISGAHKTCNLTNKRLPITVRMILGPVTKTNRYQQSHTPLVLRLENLVQDDEIFVYSLPSKAAPEGQYLNVPLNAHIRLAPLNDQTGFHSSAEFKSLMRTCDRIRNSLYDRIMPYVDHQFTTSDNIFKWDGNRHPDDGVPPDDFGDSFSMNDEEIDQIYDYIRGVNRETVNPDDDLGIRKTSLEDGTNNRHSTSNNEIGKPKTKRIQQGSPEGTGSSGPSAKAQYCQKKQNIYGHIAKSRCYSKSTDKLANYEQHQKPASPQICSDKHSTPIYHMPAHLPNYLNSPQDDRKIGRYRKFEQIGENSRQLTRSGEKIHPLYPINNNNRVYKSCHNLLDGGGNTEEGWSNNFKIASPYTGAAYKNNPYSAGFNRLNLR